MIAAGQRSQAEFYNDWLIDADTPLLPTRLAESVRLSEGDEVFNPSPRTLTHPALSKIADSSKSDFTGTLISSYRPQVVPENLSTETSVGARLNNGDILLSSRKVGNGNVVLLGTSLDTSSGNLVTRQSFLPLIHELVYYLADPAAYDLNLDPGWEVSIGLTTKGGQGIGTGLTGRYFTSHNAKAPTITRQDETIQFNWIGGTPGPGIPNDNFRVEWTGKMQVPRKGRYTFTADIDDYLEVWLDGKRIASFDSVKGSRKAQANLEAGRWYDFKAIYRENSGDARAILFWECEHFGRQVIPPQSFRIFSESDKKIKTGRDSALAEFAVIGPDNKPRTAQLSSTGRGSVLSLKGDIATGLYKLQVPEDQTLYFADFLKKDSLEIPFTVKRDPAESHLTKLTEADYAFLANFVTLAEPQTLEELIAFLNGNQFGQELWKYLAIGAFLFLLVEIALSRWISRSRRMGEDIKIQFEAKDAPGSGFQEQLAKMGKT